MRRRSIASFLIRAPHSAGALFVLTLTLTLTLILSSCEERAESTPDWDKEARSSESPTAL